MRRGPRGIVQPRGKRNVVARKRRGGVRVASNFFERTVLAAAHTHTHTHARRLWENADRTTQTTPLEDPPSPTLYTARAGGRKRRHFLGWSRGKGTRAQSVTGAGKRTGLASVCAAWAPIDRLARGVRGRRAADAGGRYPRPRRENLWPRPGTPVRSPSAGCPCFSRAPGPTLPHIRSPGSPRERRSNTPREPPQRW